MKINNNKKQFVSAQKESFITKYVKYLYDSFQTIEAYSDRCGEEDARNRQPPYQMEFEIGSSGWNMKGSSNLRRIGVERRKMTLVPIGETGLQKDNHLRLAHRDR